MTAIIIKMLCLPDSASSHDIRKFFMGLKIPDGGVHIVGGDDGIVFIAFAGDDDARQAMSKDGLFLKENNIKLFLSSKSEMEQVISDFRKKKQTMMPPIAGSLPNPMSAPPSIPMGPLYGGPPPNLYNPPPLALSVPPFSQPPPYDTNPYNPNKRPRSRSPDTYRPMGLGPGGHNHFEDGRKGSSMNPAAQRDLESYSFNNGNNRHNPNMNPQPHYPNPPSTNSQYNSVGSGDHVQNGFNSFPISRPIQGSVHPNNNVINNMSPLPHHPIVRSGNSFNNNQENQRFPSPNNQLPAPPPLTLMAQMAPTTVPSVPSKMTPKKIELRGLPTENFNPGDIQEFFQTGAKIFIPEGNIRILVNDMDQLTGGAKIIIEKDEDVGPALSCNGRMMTNRVIEVKLLVEDPPKKQDPIVYMKGLPFSACTTKDVCNFFGGLFIVDIVFEMDKKSGRSAGNAFVEFGSIEDFEAALTYNMRHMGKRYIEVFPTNRPDMEEAKQYAFGGKRWSYCVLVSNLPETYEFPHIVNYFKESGCKVRAVHRTPRPNNHVIDSCLELIDLESQKNALRRNGGYVEKHNIKVEVIDFATCCKMNNLPFEGPVPQPFAPSVARGGGKFERGAPGGGRGGFRGSDGPGHYGKPMDRDREFGGRGRGGRGRGGGNGSFHDRGGDMDREYRKNVPDDVVGGSEEPFKGNIASGGGNGGNNPFHDNRCVVHISNLAYQASIDDLGRFFSTYSIAPGGIERRMNERGQATPEARMAFINPMEAERAVNLMHKKVLYGREIFLRLG